jgi:hypothetical protein
MHRHDGALNILKVISFYQYVVWGVLLIFALAIDTARRAFIAKSLLNRAMRMNPEPSDLKAENTELLP